MNEKNAQVIELVTKLDEVIINSGMTMGIALDSLSLMGAHLAVLMEVDKDKYLEGTEAMYNFQQSKKMEQAEEEAK